LRSLGVEVVDVESIEVSNNGGLPGGVKGSASELLDFIVL
jgi:hypothetical protein